VPDPMYRRVVSALILGLGVVVLFGLGH